MHESGCAQPVFKCLLGRRQQPALHEQVSASGMSPRWTQNFERVFGFCFLIKADCPGGSGSLLNIMVGFSASSGSFLPAAGLCER